MTNNILEAVGVSKAYANHQALSEVNINIPRGQIFGLLGPNGAGKTTFIRIINQITGPDTGHILFNGEKLHPKHVEEIGYLPEERGLYKKMKVGEQLMYLAQLKGMKKSEALEKLKYWFIKFDIKDWWNKNVEDLSKGMAQKTQFIATIVHEPSLIILDEPFSGFDPINANLLKDEILELKEKGTTIIFSTHRMESVEELCDNICLINKSRAVLQGSKKDIKQQFKENLFEIKYSGNLVSDSSLFTIKSAETNEGLVDSLIALNDGVSTGQVLQNLISQVDIKYFSEKVPTFNEIFIKVVGEDANSILVS